MRIFWTWRYLFVCVFVWVLSSHLRIFLTFGDVTINAGSLQMLTYTRYVHVWPLSSEGSLSCNTEHESSVCNYHLRGPVTLAPIAEHLTMELSLPVYDLGLSQLGFEHRTFCLLGERSNRLRHRRGTTWQNKSVVSVYRLNVTINRSINPI